MVSWYQYAGSEDVQRIVSLQQHVVRKFARLDEDDGQRWGEELGRQACAFVDAFGRRPETLAMYMWRVHWNAPAPPAS